MQLVWLDNISQQLLQNFDVLIILMNRILKFIAIFIKFLRLGLLSLATKDPAFIVFGFNHKQAIRT